MPGRLKTGLVILVTWFASPMSGQDPGSLAPMLEELLYREENPVLPEELMERFEETEGILLDLNRASEAELKESGLFNPFQVHQLISYRTRYGAFFSIYELAFIPGFDSTILTRLESRMRFGAEPEKPVRRLPKTMLMIDTGRKFPVSIAYLPNPDDPVDKLYAGSPISTTVRFRSHFGDRLSLGLTYEKDAGEEFLFRGRPQFLSGYVQYRGDGILQKLVAGNFQLQHGLGLVNGTGFLQTPSSLRVNRQTLSLLSPYASKTEYRFERGLAFQLGGDSFRVLGWVSHTLQDLATGTFKDSPDETRWWEYQRTTGLHRTRTEMEGRELAARISGGIQLLYRDGQWALGTMTGVENFALTKQGVTLLGTNVHPQLFRVASLHANWHGGPLQLFGEMATDESFSLNFQLGSRVQFNDYLQGTLMFHRFGKDYRGLRPSTCVSGTRMEQEQGLTFHLHMEPGKRVLADVTGEISRYNSPRYQTLVPSMAYRVTLTLQNPGMQTWHWKIRAVSKTWQRTPDEGSRGIRPLKEFQVNRLDLHLTYGSGTAVTWQSRLILSHIRPSDEPIPAYAAMQQAGLRADPRLQATLQFVLFRVREWDNRIYLYEPGLYYSFSFPVYYGHGQKTTFLFAWKVIRGITLSAKVSCIAYFDREETGSGNDRAEGNRLWESGLQLRLSL
jgi:hypothetical protein